MCCKYSEIKNLKFQYQATRNFFLCKDTSYDDNNEGDDNISNNDDHYYNKDDGGEYYYDYWVHVIIWN